jgi:hypothetical protein
MLFASPLLVVKEKQRLDKTAIKEYEEAHPNGAPNALAETDKADKSSPRLFLVKDSGHHAGFAPWVVKNRRDVFASDIARFLEESQDNRFSKVSYTSFDVPPYTGRDKEEYIRRGVMKVNGGTFMLDTTLNSGLLRAVQECGYMPAVIMTYFTFWWDRRDQDKKALEDVYAM